MARLLIIAISFLLFPGCGFLDDDLLLSDEAFELTLEDDTISVGGIGLTGYGYGCGGAYHWGGHGSWGLGRRIYIHRIKPPRLQAGVTNVQPEHVGSIGGVSEQTETGDEQEEETTEELVFENEEDFWKAFEAYLAAGYDVKDFDLDSDIVISETAQVAVLLD